MRLDARPPDLYYFFDDGESERYTGRIFETINSAKKLASSEGHILRSQPCTEARNRRCGRPHEFSHAADKALMFLPTIQSSLGDTEPVDSFSMKKDFIVSFFGKDWSSALYPFPQDANVPPIGLAAASKPRTIHEEKIGKRASSQQKVVRPLEDQSKAANDPYVASIRRKRSEEAETEIYQGEEIND